MRALITGVAGFAGSHLADHLLSLGHEISGLLLPGTDRENIRHLEGRIALHAGDLLDRRGLARLLRAERPDRVFHLAALSAVAASWEEPARTMEVNVAGALHLLEVCLPLGEEVRVVAVSSAEVHEKAPLGGTLDEEAPFAPANPYAVSKLAMDLAAGQYARHKGLHLIRMRPTNHAGPRQGPGFVVADFARQIAEIEAGRREPLMRVGNLEAARDFTDVRDVVRAYALAAERGRPGEAYLVCSGRVRPIAEVLEGLLALARTPVAVETDPARFRPADPSHGAASAEKLRRDTGWQAEIPFETTLRDTLGYWRERVSGARPPA